MDARRCRGNVSQSSKRTNAPSCGRHIIRRSSRWSLPRRMGRSRCGVASEGGGEAERRCVERQKVNTYCMLIPPIVVFAHSTGDFRRLGDVLDLSAVSPQDRRQDRRQKYENQLQEQELSYNRTRWWRTIMKEELVRLPFTAKERQEIKLRNPHPPPHMCFSSLLTSTHNPQSTSSPSYRPPTPKLVRQ
jgi:hypothetical protein